MDYLIAQVVTDWQARRGQVSNLHLAVLTTIIANKSLPNPLRRKAQDTINLVTRNNIHAFLRAQSTLSSMGLGWGRMRRRYARRWLRNNAGTIARAYEKGGRYPSVGELTLRNIVLLAHAPHQGRAIQLVMEAKHHV